MKILKKCVVLPWERYNMLLRAAADSNEPTEAHLKESPIYSEDEVKAFIKPDSSQHNTSDGEAPCNDRCSEGQQEGAGEQNASDPSENISPETSLQLPQYNVREDADEEGEQTKVKRPPPPGLPIKRKERLLQDKGEPQVSKRKRQKREEKKRKTSWKEGWLAW